MAGLLAAHQPMRAVIQILLLNGAPVAGLISGGFATPAQKQLYALHIAFDNAQVDSAPGSAVLLMGLRHAIDGGYGSYNLLSGFGHYKHRWLAQSTAARSAQIYRLGRLPFWRRLFGDAKRALLRIAAHGTSAKRAAVQSDAARRHA
jgi:hypothetical protein